MTAVDSAGRRRFHWGWIGAVPYGPTAALQEALRQDIRFGRGEEHFLLLEHDPPVYTVGRNASEADVVAGEAWRDRLGIEVHTTNRGGKVTFHGPGQLVGYPIVDLDPDRRDIRRFVFDLQEVLIRTLADYGIEGERRDGQDFIGVWVGPRKIASIGIHLARWITNHGFALNVGTDLDLFGGIIACGLPDVQMTSMEQLLGAAPPLAEVAERVGHHALEIYERDGVALDPEVVRRRLEEHARETQETATQEAETQETVG